MADNNFKGGPGGRLQKEEAKNVNFGFMRPTISPLNQQQFMNVATGRDPGFQGQATMEQLREKMRGYKPEQIKASGRLGGYNPVNPIVFGQNPKSAGAMLGKILTLGGEPMPGQGYSFSPTETLKGAAFDFVTGEGIGAGVKAAAPYVKPMAEKLGKNLYSYYLKKAPWTFKPNPEAYYHRSPDLRNIINTETKTLQGFGGSEAGKEFSELAQRGVEGGINLKKAANPRLFYAKGTPLDYGRYNPSGQGYKGPYLVEAEGVPMVSATQNKSYKLPPTSLEGYAVSSRPVGMEEAKFYVEDFLRGYKPVKVSVK